MSSPIYSPTIKMFYGSERITPVPLLNISTELAYSNDTVIGYNYVISLNGQITEIDLSNNDSSGQFGIGSVIDHAHQIRKILIQNGNTLKITDHDNIILEAKGGILKSFDISDSSNNWMHFANYTATIEFQYVNFNAQDNDNCASPFLSEDTYNKQGILDISKYKIKSFNDSWSFKFNENDFYDIAKIKNENDVFTNIDNTSFTIDYSINAVGRDTYNYNQDNTTMIPGWEQAKNFVQDRLHNQIINLIDKVLDIKDEQPCSASGHLNDLMTIPAESGLLKTIATQYSIFNETINTNFSESEGSFSVSYSAIVKRDENNNYSTSNTKHKISKSIEITNNGGVKTTLLKINGSIEGLVPGGLIRRQYSLELPSSGSFLINKHSLNKNIKYDNAKILLDKLYDQNDYSGGIGLSGKRDLKVEFKDVLGITYEKLGLDNNSFPDDNRPYGPSPISFNLTHDYINGTINYSVEYSSNSVCGRKYREISIQKTPSTEVYAIFDIPNSNSVSTFQKLNTITAPKISVTITGVDLSDNGQPRQFSILNEFDTGYISSHSPISLPLPYDKYILTSRQYTKNPMTGSFTISQSFICNTNGCFIN